MSRSSSTEIRENRKSALLGTLVGWIIRLWSMTLRFEIVDRCGICSADRSSPPVIYAMWHNRIFMVPPAWRMSAGKFHPAVVLTSASKDGSILARAMAVFGIGAVRGSSSRRAVAALIGMKRALKEGTDVCITPDGPRGPRYDFQPGVVKLAESSGAPIVPIHVTCPAAWQLKTWDRFLIPKPFSRVRVVFDSFVSVPPGLDDAAFEDHRLRLRQILLDGTDDS